MSPTRRAYLRVGIAAGLAALAGCANRSADSSTETDGTPAPGTNSGPFRDLSFEGGNLVVALAPEHNLSGVTLIAPDGTIFEQVAVATGVRTVRIPVLDPQPDDGGYRHYTPGVHELVGVDAEGDEVGSRVVPMQPKIELVGIEQYRSGDRPSDFGSLVVTVENTGTAPTWVYDITYRDAPNFAADTELGENPGVLSVKTTSETTSVLAPPNGRSSYIDATSPLVFNRDRFAGCSAGLRFSALIGIANGEVLEAQVAGTIDGDALSVGLVDEYVCSEVRLTVVNEVPESTDRSTTTSRS